MSPRPIGDVEHYTRTLITRTIADRIDAGVKERLPWVTTAEGDCLRGVVGAAVWASLDDLGIAEIVGSQVRAVQAGRSTAPAGAAAGRFSARLGVMPPPNAPVLPPPPSPLRLVSEERLAEAIADAEDRIHATVLRRIGTALRSIQGRPL